MKYGVADVAQVAHLRRHVRHRRQAAEPARGRAAAEARQWLGRAAAEARRVEIEKLKQQKREEQEADEQRRSDAPIGVGSDVQIRGLVGRPELNGAYGRIVSTSAGGKAGGTSGKRFIVEVTGSATKERLGVRPENLVRFEREHDRDDPLDALDGTVV